MLVRLSVVSLLVSSTCTAWTPSLNSVGTLRSATASSTASRNTALLSEPETLVDTPAAPLTQAVINKLPFRQLQAELEQRHMPMEGTTAQLRSRLKEAAGLEDECIVNDAGTMPVDCEDDGVISEARMDAVMDFVDESDPDYERKELLLELEDKVEKGHWKAATRKLKRYSRRFAEQEPVSESTFLSVLEVCMANRLQGARASEPARKILEQMVEQGYRIPESAGNYCIKNCLGTFELHGTHQGFGGIDTALAMISALEQSQTPIQLDTYDKVCTALANEGSIDQALTMLRKVVADLSQTPNLATFAQVAHAAAASVNENKETLLEQVEKVPTVLAYAKAAGYDLDSIASVEDGRELLAAGVIAAEKMDNVALGLRLLTAASKAPGVDPDRGDDLVASSSTAAQRASTLIHKRAINRAVQDKQWKLAVKVLELMLERSLKPSKYVWRNVLTCTAKAERSRKATGLLLQWVELAQQGKSDMPPLSVFNTVLNVCEICGEQDLTLKVLDTMKQCHDTEGNIITFNIALKRLAKQGNQMACEGMIIGMLKEGIEPTVVSYTTAIASCVSNEQAKQPAAAYEWLKRMRSRLVNPNVLSYNTALASCLDGKLDSTVIASKIASEMLRDAELQLQKSMTASTEDASSNDKKSDRDNLTNVYPDSSSKFLARRLIEQLDQAVEAGEMDRRVADETLKVSLQAVADYVDCDTNECLIDATATGTSATMSDSDEADDLESTSQDEMELEVQAINVHKIAEV